MQFYTNRTGAKHGARMWQLNEQGETINLAILNDSNGNNGPIVFYGSSDVPLALGYYHKVRYHFIKGGEVQVYGKETEDDDFVLLNKDTEAYPAPHMVDTSQELYIGMWDGNATNSNTFDVEVKAVKI